MKKIAVIGSRGFNDAHLLAKTLAPLLPFELISGGAKGADQLAEAFADAQGLSKQIFKADWKRYGRGAGAIRNRLLVEACDQVIAFWDGESKGTAHSVSYARSLGKQVKIVLIQASMQVA